MKTPLRLWSLVQLPWALETYDYSENRHIVPSGALIFVIAHLDDDEDALHRFVGLWEGNLLKFYLFSSEVKQL